MRKNVYGLKNFTSYFDRKVMRLSSVAEYLDNRDYWSTEQTSFALNDGVLSSVVFNLTAAQMEEIESGGIPNYAIVCEGDRILSRWYVTEGKYVREGQYELSLRRDVVADYMDEILDADCLVDRAPLPPTSPYIYNREDMAFNQIKVGEALIKDETETAWIVGYVSDDTTDTSTVVADTDQSQTSSYPTLAQSLPGVVWNDPADPSQGGVMGACTGPIDYITSFRTRLSPGSPTDQRVFLIHSPGVGSPYPQQANIWDAATITLKVDNLDNSYDRAAALSLRWDQKVEGQRTALDGAFSSVNSIETRDGFDAAMDANGRIFYDSVNQKYYRLTVTQIAISNYVDECPVAGLPDLRTRLLALSSDLSSELGSDSSYWDQGIVRASATVATLRIDAQEVSVEGQLKTTMSVTRRKLTDAPYDMFCLPFTEGNLALAQRIVSAPPAASTVKKIYDMQILPFCPRRDIVPTTPGDPLDDGDLTEGIDYQTIYSTTGGSDVAVSKLYWCIKSSYSFLLNLPEPITVSGSSDASVEMKVSDLCDLYRLSSPNYSSSFDMSLAKNGGTISSFKVDFTYRPVMPYIHVCPVFAGLYGSFNNDARGLICGGDYSVDMISDPWTEYMSNNKNYENIFNTQVKKLDAIREYDRGALALSGIMTTVGATAAGAVKGGLAGAAVGLVAGGVRSLGQYAFSEGKFQAERKAMVETFSYELGNVKAAPDTLTKVSAYNVNNKYFPVLEIYTSTSEEKEAARKYLRLFNFKVGVVGTLRSFLEQGRTKSWEFVRGQLALLPSSAKSEDSHFISEAYAEIEKGVFIYG